MVSYKKHDDRFYARARHYGFSYSNAITTCGEGDRRSALEQAHKLRLERRPL